jgi:hypothetical protein
MAINDFGDNTCVAFIDIVGFKKLMRNRDKAYNVLGYFYQVGYESLKQTNIAGSINGLFVTDCGILFIRDLTQLNANDLIVKLLNVVKTINRRMLSFDTLLITSIAYGYFHYENKLEFNGITKDPIFGHGYVDAYLDAEHGLPKLIPGQCRILTNNMPGFINAALTRGELSECIRTKDGENNHLYYYWSCDSMEQVCTINDKYQMAENAKYKMIIDAHKANIGQP